MKAKLFGRIFWQSLFLQANWNFERMQNLGFLMAVLPALPEITPSKAEQKAIARRHLEYFNTQPYFASVIIGSTIAQEKSRLENGFPEVASINKAKNDMMGPFAALGDSLFWATMKPFLGMVAVFLILINQVTWAPLLFLFLYNVPHLFVRAGGLIKGYTQQFGVVQTVFKFRCQTLIKTLKMMGLILIGSSLPVFAPRVSWPLPQHVNYYFVLLVFTVITLFLSLLMRRRISPLWLLIGLLAGCLVFF